VNMKIYFMMVVILFSSSIWADKKDHQIKLLKNPNMNRGSRLTKQDPISLERLEQMFLMDEKTPGLSAMLKKHSFHLKEKAVPTLIKVMKTSKYPIQNRWHATMLLARIMGTKSSPFIAKFTEHPHWMMRLASLKALLGLKQNEYTAVYSKALKDPSMIVRVQALDNISQLKITTLSNQVWKMMYDQSNYTGEKGSRKRTSIVKSIIRTLGDIKYQKAKGPFAKLILKPKYQDLVDDLDYSLEKITGKSSPDSLDLRRKFWTQVALNNPKKI
jgi:hypothetical protein